MSNSATVLLWKDIHDIAGKVCKVFGLSYGKILPLTNNQARYFGKCRSCEDCAAKGEKAQENCQEREILLRLHQNNNKNKALSRRTILSTLAHELAHLKYWHHSAEHDALYREIFNFMKDEGYM